MRHFFLALCCALLGLAAAESARASSATDVVRQLQAKYRKPRDFQARFEQIYTFRAMKRKKVSRGMVYFAKPRKFRFIYRAPEPKRIVSDGKTVWTYHPEHAQVHVTAFDPKIAASVRVFWGGDSDSLEKEFAVRALADSGHGDKGDHVLELTPHKDQGHYQRILLVVDPGTFLIKESVIFDPMGNVNHLRWSKMETNIGIPAKRFRFKIPDGVQVIRQDAGSR